MSTPKNYKEKSTISDFSTQWTRFEKQEGVYASEKYFFSYFGDLLKPDELRGKKIAEVGCGNGRFVKILSGYGEEVVGYEPSEAIEVAKKYCLGCHNAYFLKKSVYDIEDYNKFDFVFCLGVIHHLPDEISALRKIKSMLAKNGCAYIWVYGKENNKLYLNIFLPIIKITSTLPHWALNFISFVLTAVLKFYIYIVGISRFLSWPMKKYMLNVLKPLNFYFLKLVVYDQLNPKIANYYTEKEITDLARQAGFKKINSFHRYGYSWTLKLS